MIVAIASGKGGTGKTSVAVNLARMLDTPIQLLDCDVEEPNAHLFLAGTPIGEETIISIVRSSPVGSAYRLHERGCVTGLRSTATPSDSANTRKSPSSCQFCRISVNRNRKVVPRLRV